MTTGSGPEAKALARQGRHASLVIAVTAALWIVATWAGSFWDWPQRTRALFDLIALAGFAFGMVVAFRTWRARRKDEG